MTELHAYQIGDGAEITAMAWYDVQHCRGGLVTVTSSRLCYRWTYSARSGLDGHWIAPIAKSDPIAVVIDTEESPNIYVQGIHGAKMWVPIRMILFCRPDHQQVQDKLARRSPATRPQERQQMVSARKAPPCGKLIFTQRRDGGSLGKQDTRGRQRRRRFPVARTQRRWAEEDVRSSPQERAHAASVHRLLEQWPRIRRWKCGSLGLSVQGRHRRTVAGTEARRGGLYAESCGERIYQMTQLNGLTSTRPGRAAV